MTLAKELKVLGVPQVSEFYWEDEKLVYIDNPDDLPLSSKAISAFLASEIEEWLPDAINTERDDGRAPENRWSCKRYRNGQLGIDHPNVKIEDFWAQTMCDALGKMLIYLIKNNLLDPSTLTRKKNL